METKYTSAFFWCVALVVNRPLTFYEMLYQLEIRNYTMSTKSYHYYGKAQVAMGTGILTLNNLEVAEIKLTKKGNQ